MEKSDRIERILWWIVLPPAIMSGLAVVALVGWMLIGSLPVSLWPTGSGVKGYAERLCVIAVEYQAKAGPGLVLAAKAVRDDGGYVTVRADLAGGVASCGFERESLNTGFPALTSLSINGRAVMEPEFFYVAAWVGAKAPDVK